MKKFLTVLLVIAVMFTFSFSSAFANTEPSGVNGLDTVIEEAKATVESYANMGDYDNSKQAQILTEKANFYQNLDNESLTVVEVLNMLASYTDFVDGLTKTDLALAKTATLYNKKLLAYEEALEIALSVESEHVDCDIAAAAVANKVFDDANTQAEFDAIFAIYKGKIDAKAKSYKKATVEAEYGSNSVATDEYKLSEANKIRARYAHLDNTSGTWTKSTFNAISNKIDEAVAAVKAAKTVNDVVAAIEKYTGSGKTVAKYNGAGNFVLVKEAYGEITALIDQTIDLSDNVVDAADLVKYIEANYKTTEINYGETEVGVYGALEADKSYWDLAAAIYEDAQLVADGYSENDDNIYDWTDAADAYSDLNNLTRGKAESANISSTTNVALLKMLFDAEGEEGVETYFTAKSAEKAQKLIDIYTANVAVATSLAEVRALQDGLYEDLSALKTSYQDYLENLVDEFIYGERGLEQLKISYTDVNYDEDAQAAIDWLYKEAVAQINDDNQMMAYAAEYAMLEILEIEGYTSSEDRYHYASESSLLALDGYIGLKLIDDGYITCTDFEPSDWDFDSMTSMPVKNDPTYTGYKTNQYYADLAVQRAADRMESAYRFATILEAYDDLMASFDGLTLMSDYEVTKAYTDLETALKKLADNPADDKAASKTRAIVANSAFENLMNVVEGEYADYYTAEQVAVIEGALRTIADYYYAYELACEDPDELLSLTSVVETYHKVKNAYDATKYTLADQSAIQKTINSADLAINAATTVADKDAAAQAAIDTILAVVPKDVARIAATYVDDLNNAKLVAQKYFAAYENKSFVSNATNGYALRDEIIAGSTFDVKAAIANLKAVARSVKTSKGNIKVTVVADTTALEAAGYSVSYKFYRSTKSNKNYVAKKTKTTNTYTNTTGTKGVKYFYKAKLVVKDAAGNTVGTTALTQCKYACRTK